MQLPTSVDFVPASGFKKLNKETTTKITNLNKNLSIVHTIVNNEINSLTNEIRDNLHAPT